MKTAPVGDFRDGKIRAEHFLRRPDSPPEKIVIKGCAGIFVEQPRKMELGKADIGSGVHERNIFTVVFIDIVKQSGKFVIVDLSVFT